jgi:hypothetical protein
MKNVKEIIESLSNVDGETMQHILEEAGMELQMLRQLIMTAPAGLVESLVEEKKTIQSI